MPPTDTSTRALPTLHEFFSPGGILARSSLPYEYRPGQLEWPRPSSGLWKSAAT